MNARLHKTAEAVGIEWIAGNPSINRGVNERARGACGTTISLTPRFSGVLQPQSGRTKPFQRFGSANLPTHRGVNESVRGACSACASRALWPSGGAISLTPHFSGVLQAQRGASKPFQRFGSANLPTHRGVNECVRGACGTCASRALWSRGGAISLTPHFSGVLQPQRGASNPFQRFGSANLPTHRGVNERARGACGRQAFGSRGGAISLTPHFSGVLQPQREASKPFQRFGDGW
jgi:hypothetical protein